MWSVQFPDHFDYVILGARRSGTHWLASRLCSHPEVGNFGELAKTQYSDWMGLRQRRVGPFGYILHYRDLEARRPEDEELIAYHRDRLSDSAVIHLLRDPESCAMSWAANEASIERASFDGGYKHQPHFRGHEAVESWVVSRDVVRVEAERVCAGQRSAREYLEEEDSRCLELCYEGLRDDTGGWDRKMLEFLGVEPVKLTSSLVQTRREVTVA